MKLYNTLTRKVENISPISPPSVTVYTCGPTVYDYAHIGHWFTYVRMDTLIRALNVNNFKPIWVMNITDVGHLVSDADEGEDKLEKGAKREGKTAWEVAEFYTSDFVECMSLLGISTPDYMPKATDHIAEQIELIKILENKNFTYSIDDGVYFDTSKFSKYSEFARLDIDEQIAGARVQFNPQKRNIADFALWKFSPAGTKRDMEWESPWGTGFPGWHIECSAMSMKYLGETIDIHTGGIDHIPVHHANEIAQSESATGKTFVNLWMHTNHVLIDGQKISKSLGNGIRLQEIPKKHLSYEAFRLHVLESHYRSQSKFSWDSLHAAQNRLEDLRALAALKWQPKKKNSSNSIDFSKINNEIMSCLNNDLNTPQLLAYLSGVSSEIQKTLVCADNIKEFISLIDKLDSILGLNLSSIQDIDQECKDLLSQRISARDNKDWHKSDLIREELKKKGIGIRDTELDAIWFPVS